MSEVAVSQLHHRYPEGEADVLAGVDLTIADGEAHALLGSSGSGKTTLLNILSGLLTPTSGNVRFDGQEVVGLAPGARGVAQVFQFPALYEPLSIHDNLGFALKVRGQSDADARAIEIAEALELGDTGRKPRELSLFEKQKVAIGKALIRRDTRLVLLDEPLTAVEPRRKWELRRTLMRLQRQHGITMIYVTHDQTEALTFAERVTVIHEGRVLQTDTPANLVERPAHEHVGFFIGSPGMNFVRNTAHPDRSIGFRPEWVSVAPGTAGTVTAVEVTGIRAGIPHGLITVTHGDAHVIARQAIRVAVGDKVDVQVHRQLEFANGWNLDAPR